MKKCNENGQRQITRMLGPKNEFVNYALSLTQEVHKFYKERHYRQIDRQTVIQTDKKKCSQIDKN